MKRLLALLLLLSPAQAEAYELTGAAWRMNAYPSGVPYCPVMNASDATTATMRAAFTNVLDAGMLAWTEAGMSSESVPGIPCSAYRVEKSSCPGSPSQGDGYPWVWWETNWGSISGVGSSTIGVTPWWSSGSEITLAKVIFNDRDYYWSVDGSATDVGSIAVHEFGHFLGLDHYDEYSSSKRQECGNATYPSVMCSFYSDGIARVPTADDALGLCYLYPQVGAVGSACSSGSSCNSGVCHADGYCSAACPPSCPLGYSCVGGQCQRDQAPPTCPPCGDAPCGAGSICIGASGGSICAPPCNSNTDCPLGFWCGVDTGSGGACWPLSNSCSSSGPVAGQACAGDGICALGYFCLQTPVGDRCYEACDTRDDCSNASDRCFQTNEPGVGYCDAESTTCACDTDSACQAGCACDRDCSDCACNSTTRCDDGCSCDPHCARCSCNTTLRCDGGCQCDPDCSGSCACDLTVACDYDCACDPQCPCFCDATTVCDDGCPCDPECLCLCDQTTKCDADCDYCDPECGGCFSAALIPDSPGGRADLWPLLGVFVGLGLLRRRRHG